MSSCLVLATGLTRALVDNRTRVARQLLRGLKIHYVSFDERKRCFFSGVATTLFKNCEDRRSGNCAEKSSPPKCDDPCRTRKDCDDRTSSNACKDTLRKSAPEKLVCESPLDDPCPRDCKLSSKSRCSSDSSSEDEFSSEPPTFWPINPDAPKKQRLWKLLTVFGGLPIVIIASFITKDKVEEEAKKPRPKYVPMDYLYRRTKRFPWGDGNHSLFHNPVKNAVPPHGYEVDDPNAVD